MANCYICGRLMHEGPPKDEAMNCGGDCLGCMQEAEAGQEPEEEDLLDG